MAKDSTKSLSMIETFSEFKELKNIDKACIIDPKNNPDRDKYANLLFEIRKSKGMTMEQAQGLEFAQRSHRRSARFFPHSRW